ncbi:hypothetical protein O3P69_017759 [Scylla paramamosain]|uniref:Uncharacterized protein n=1 Tax=Scylla paramamosain TaxID=85552 RepID=A0AAW0SFJ1_SCYPA
MRLTALLHVWFFSCSCVTLVPAIRLEPTEDGWEADAATLVKDVLLGSSKSDAYLVIIAGKGFSREVRRFLGASRSVVVFEAARNGSRLAQVITRSRQVRLASWMVVVVVVSDDPVFLAAFAQQAREGRLLVWATRLIVVSRRAPHRLHPLHQILALTNSLLLLVDGAPEVNRMSGEAELMVAMERNHRHLMKEEPDPTAPDGVRVQFKGFMVTVLDYLAQGGNLHDRGWTVRALEFSDDSKLQRL